MHIPPEAIILFFAGMYVVELNETMKMYRNIISFHRAHNYHWPGNVISRASFVHGFMGEKQPLQAWYEIVEALKYNPQDMRMNLLAAEVCLCMADRNSAQAHLNIAVQNCYDGQFESQKGHFQEIQARINKPTVFQQEGKRTNKYSPAAEDTKRKIAKEMSEKLQVA